MSAPLLRFEMADDRIRDYLADREGLTGSARTRFREILDQYSSFRPAAVRRTWRTPLLTTVLVSGFCYALDVPSQHWTETMVWPGSLALSFVPLWCIRQREKRRPRVDADTEWRAYCLFLRPLIIAEHPGLLDRNLGPMTSVPDDASPRPSVMLQDFVRVRGLDFWWSALAGIWCGMIAVLVLRHLVPLGIDRWLALLLPGAGLVTGLAVGALGQVLIYSLARRNAGSLE